LPPFAIEVSPRFGYDEDSFAAAWSKLAPKPEIKTVCTLNNGVRMASVSRRPI